LTTARLLLRQWRAEDRDAFAALNADPEVMAHFPARLSREESDAMMDRLEAGIEADGFGLWAVQERRTGVLLGTTGLGRVSFAAPFVPAVEVGWRFVRAAWGHGFATEAAGAALSFGFDAAELDEIVAMAVPHNRRSLAVMDRLGMQRDPDGDFDHPRVPVGPLQRHVLYRIDAPAWRGRGRDA
jgi:ribosomal-protein-alanine N-acetyltransferase